MRWCDHVPCSEAFSPRRGRGFRCPCRSFVASQPETSSSGPAYSWLFEVEVRGVARGSRHFRFACVYSEGTASEQDPASPHSSSHLFRRATNLQELHLGVDTTLGFPGFDDERRLRLIETRGVPSSCKVQRAAEWLPKPRLSRSVVFFWRRPPDEAREKAVVPRLVTLSESLTRRRFGGCVKENPMISKTAVEIKPLPIQHQSLAISLCALPRGCCQSSL